METDGRLIFDNKILSRRDLYKGVFSTLEYRVGKNAVGM